MKKLLFVLVIGIIALSGCGGSGIPKVGGQQGSLTLKFAGSGPNGTSFHKYDVQAGSSVTIPALAVGIWTIGVDAKNSDKTNIGAGFSEVEVISGATNTANVIVQPLEGNGTLNLQMKWPSGIITNPNIVGTLIPTKGGPAINVPFSVFGETATSDSLSLAAGYYNLQVKLQDGGTDRWGAMDVVRIIAGQTSNGEFPLNATPGKTGKIELAVVPDLQSPITISFNGQQETLPMGTEMAVNANTSEPVGSYQWYLNGELLPGETGGSIAIGSSLDEGSYRLDLVVTKGNIASAGNLNFMVTGSADTWAKSYGGPSMIKVNPKLFRLHF